MLPYYYWFAIVSYGLFILQSIIALCGHDTDYDVDFDGNMDFSTSDVLTFKGLIHFLMGFSGWLVVSNQYGLVTGLLNHIIAVLIGVAFMVSLFYLYKLCLKLQHQPTPIEGEQLVNSSGTVYLVYEDGSYILTVNGEEVKGRLIGNESDKCEKGDVVKIQSYKDGIYYFTKNI